MSYEGHHTGMKRPSFTENDVIRDGIVYDRAPSDVPQGRHGIREREEVLSFPDENQRIMEELEWESRSGPVVIKRAAKK